MKNFKEEVVFIFLEGDNFYKVLGGMGSSGKVLGYILRVYNDKTGMFYFSSRVKEEMCEELAMSIGTVRNVMKKFADSKIILRVSGAVYMVNPYVFYKGAQEMLPKMRILYDSIEKSKK